MELITFILLITYSKNYTFLDMYSFDSINFNLKYYFEKIYFYLKAKLENSPSIKQKEEMNVSPLSTRASLFSKLYFYIQ